MTTNTDPNTSTVRPELLKVLCILTFIGSGLSLISNAMMFMTVDILREMYNNGSFDFLSDSMNLEGIELLINVERSYFLVQAVVFAGSFYGAYQMWQLKKIGFHVYTVSQILLIIISQIYLPNLPFPLFELMLSLVFITFYARNLKYMIK